jgi:hypothetical protein
VGNLEAQVITGEVKGRDLASEEVDKLSNAQLQQLSTLKREALRDLKKGKD